MADLASLAVELTADLSGLMSGFNTANREIDNFISTGGRKLNSLGKDLTGLGTKFTAATAPIAGFFGAGLKVASDFEGIMAEIGARAGLTGSELATVANFSKDMGAATVFSSQQAADAFLQLLTSGQSVEDAMATLPVVLDAAAASGEDLGHSADLVTDIMAAFGLNVSDAQGVVDALAQAAGASSADMASLGQGFSNIGPVAKQMGLTVEDTAAVLAILAENGIKGAESGTALRSMLLNMTRPTEDVQSAWNELGTSFYDAEGNARPLNDVLADISDGMKDMPVQRQNELMKDLFGSYGIVAGSALLGSMSIEEMAAMMQEQADAATVAQARMNTFEGKINSLRGSVETLMIEALTPFMENVLTPMIGKLTEIVNKVTAWAQENPELTQKIVELAAGLLLVGPALIGAGIGLSVIASAVSAFGALIALVGLPMLGLIGIASLLGLAWATNWNGIRDKTQEIAASIKTAVDDTIAPALEDVKGKLTELNFDDMDLSAQGQIISDKITGAITQVEQTTIDTSGIQTWATDNMNTILSTVVSVAGIILGGPIGAVIGAAKLIATAIENDFLGFGTFIQDSGIADAVNSGVDTLRGILEGAFNRLTAGDNGSGAALAESFAMGEGVQAASTTSPIISTINELIDGIKRGVEAFGPELSEGFAQIGNGIRGFIDALAGADVSGLDNIFATILKIVGDIIGVHAAIFAVGFDVITDLVENVLPAIGGGIASFITILSGIGEGDPGIILQGIGDGISAFVGGVANIAAGFADPLIEGINGLMGTDLPTLSEIFDQLPGALQSILDKANEVITPIMEALQPLIDWFLGEDTGLASVVTWLETTFSGAISGIQTLLSGIWDIVKGPLENFKKGLQTVFDWIRKNVLEPFEKLVSDIAAALASLMGIDPNAVDVAGINAQYLASGGQPPITPGGPEIGFGGGLPQKARGGSVHAGSAYLVGERGMEVFMPGRTGRIIPNSDLMGGGGPNVNVNAYGDSPYEVARMIKRALAEMDA
ncbi:MAG: phage tail tape measure protein [Phyllobacteriaceae bacterium]|nr:phage tail tape measure protein [Phyllobacteriaceae bacterium]